MNFSKRSGKKSRGGIAFFFSLFFLLVISLLNIINLPILWDSNALVRVFYFGIGAGIGAWIGNYLIYGSLSVFIHELKHSIVSNLAGNRAKGMKVRKHTGHFEYEYTRDTEAYNAFIALAPYFFPVFTPVMLLIAHIFFYQDHKMLVLLVGASWGTDWLLSIRDIAPHQTDISEISGGYKVGLLYIAAMNTALFTFLLAWVMQSIFGLKLLIHGLWRVLWQVVSYYHPAAG